MFALNRSFELLRDFKKFDVINSFYVKPSQNQNHFLYSSYSSVRLNLTYSVAVIILYI